MQQFRRSLTAPCVWLKRPVPLQRGPGIFMTPGFCFQLGRAAGAEGNAAFTGARGVIGGSPFSGARRFRCQALRRQPQQFPAVKSAEFLFEGGGQGLDQGKDFFLFPGFRGTVSVQASRQHAHSAKSAAYLPHASNACPQGRGQFQGRFFRQAADICKSGKNGLGTIISLVEIIQRPGCPVFLGRDHGKKGGYCSFSADVSAAAFSGLLRSVRRSMSM